MRKTTCCMVILMIGRGYAARKSTECEVDLPKMPFKFNSLEPYIDETTVRIHYSKLFKNYALKYNEIVAEVAKESTSVQKLADEGILSVLQNLNEIKNKNLQTALRNYGGGYLNHYMLFETLAPPQSKQLTKPSGELMKAIKQEFSSYDNFLQTLKTAALSVFGSGWAWVCVEKTGSSSPKLVIATTQNQDNPIMFESQAGVVTVPIVGVDMWEHAYFLNYHSDRQAYLEGLLHVINWPAVEQNFARQLKSTTTTNRKQKNIQLEQQEEEEEEEEEEQQRQQGQKSGGFLSSIFGSQQTPSRKTRPTQMNSIRRQQQQEPEEEEEEEIEEQLQEVSRRGSKTKPSTQRLVLVAPEDLYIFS